MKKLLCVSVVLLLGLVLAACAQPPESAPSEPGLEPVPIAEPLPEAKTKIVEPPFTEPTFYLSALPQLPPHEPPSGMVTRYLPEQFVHTLKAGEDYGRLFPYMGKVYGISQMPARMYYGLADAQGRVVVEPVYRRAYCIEPENNDGQEYLLLSYPVTADDEEAQTLLNISDGSIRRGWHVVAKADGSWVSDFFYGDRISVSENRIVVTNYNADLEDMWSNRGVTYRIYDMQGNLITKSSQDPTKYLDKFIFTAELENVPDHIVANKDVIGVLNGELIITHSADYRSYEAYNLDGTPAFNGELTGSILHDFEWVGDDEYSIYSVLTSQYSGLINPNGEWLLRVNVDIIDASDNIDLDKGC